ncbi:cache domain-containing protein [Desulfovibrio sp. JY]|nr:cache domain-containing protein [Desulfovibrio sp. JY]
MRIGITPKIVVLVVSAVIIASIAVFVSGRMAFERGFTKEYDQTIEAFKNVGADSILTLRTQLRTLAKTQAVRPNVIAGISGGDVSLLSRLARDLVAAGQVKAVLFTDAAGTVLSAVGAVEGLPEALAKRDAKLRGGEETIGFVPVGEKRLPLVATAPVRKDGALVGNVGVVAEPAADNAWVDHMRKTLGVEATIFSGATRISSTIMDGGHRVIGTTTTDAQVNREVLGQGKPVFRELTLFGRPFVSVYWPLTDADGRPVGIGFVGKGMHELAAALAAVNRSAGLAAGAVVLVLAGLGFFFSRRFTRPIQALAAFSEAVAAGQLDAELTITQNDEVGDLSKALHSMVGTLRTKIGEAEAATQKAREESDKARSAQATAEEARQKGEAARREGILHAAARLGEVVTIVERATDALRGRIEQSRQGSDIQSQRVGETATSMEEMNATVLEVAQNASQAAATADQAKGKAEGGAAIVSEAMDRIAAVRDQTLTLKHDMGQLGEQAQGIGAIIGVINDIADQTNLLALNAAIEAARAGEAGRGFAVVADEVRKLAEKTMSATKEVSEAIHGIQQGTRTNVDNMERAVAETAEATVKAQESGEALGAIVTLVESAADQVRAIATATEEQSSATEEINRSIVEVNAISSETSQSMTEAEKAVSELAEQATAMVELIESMQREAAGDAAAALPV